MKSKSACFKELLWWSGKWDYRKLTCTTEQVDVLFHSVRRGRFDNLYWHGGCTWDNRQLTHTTEH